jgi:RNA recognition motif-containing protein
MEISLSNIRNNNFKDTNEKIDPDDVPLDCTTAFVKNLEYHVTEKEVEEKFKTCGDINQIRFVYEPQTNKFKGFCYIDFKEHKGLLKALKLNGSFFGNRKLYVDYEQGKPKNYNKSEGSLLNRKRY